MNTLKSTSSSQEVIQKLKARFARFGIPDELNSDNGPQYANSEFKKFAREWGFQNGDKLPVLQHGEKVRRQTPVGYGKSGVLKRIQNEQQP